MARLLYYGLIFLNYYCRSCFSLQFELVFYVRSVKDNRRQDNNSHFLHFLLLESYKCRNVGRILRVATQWRNGALTTMKHDKPHPWLDWLYVQGWFIGVLKWLKQVWRISSTIIRNVYVSFEKVTSSPDRINLHRIPNRFTDVSVNAIQVEQIYRSTTGWNYLIFTCVTFTESCERFEKKKRKQQFWIDKKVSRNGKNSNLIRPHSLQDIGEWQNESN